MHRGRTTALLFGEVGRCAAGTLADRSPPLVVYDRPVPGTPTVVWLFPVVLTVCFSPFGPKVTLALFLFKFTRTPGAIFMLRLNRKPMKYSSFAACLRFLAFSHLWDNIITVAVLLSTRTTHL